MQTRSFVTEFLQLETYDAYYEPITKYASVIALLVLLIIIGLSAVLVVLLRHKKKPWKLYIIPLVTYAFFFFFFVLTISLFSGYDSSSGTTGIRAIGDLLFIGTLPQYAVIIILLMRIFGVDLNKFDFKSDSGILKTDTATSFVISIVAISLNPPFEVIEVDIEFKSKLTFPFLINKKYTAAIIAIITKTIITP